MANDFDTVDCFDVMDLDVLERQPTLKDRHRSPRRFDQSELTVRQHGRYAHRDYMAHFFRWCQVKSAVTPASQVLDVGCGTEQPLTKVLTQLQGHVPKLYVGVDLNPITRPDGHTWARTHAEFNFIERWEELEKAYGAVFTVATCFEVIEHMARPDGEDLLFGIHALLAGGGVLYLSTPVFSGRAAAAHIHEYTVAELTEMILAAGFEVVQRAGTFADVNRLKPVLSDAERTLWDAWKHRLGNEGLSVVFATLHPDESKNNLWILRKT